MRELDFLRSARHIASSAFLSLLRPGDMAVDATLGRGRDCARLCELVGPAGRVYGFDAQEKAVLETAALLTNLGLSERAELHHLGHEHMLEVVPPGIRLAAFNLGWMPGGDKAVTTRAETTLTALDAALELLSPHGMAILCVYPGHEEGTREKEALLTFAKGLPPARFTALWHDFINGGHGAPGSLMIEKLAEPGE
jgi:hypothetical protein